MENNNVMPEILENDLIVIKEPIKDKPNFIWKWYCFVKKNDIRISDRT